MLTVTQLTPRALEIVTEGDVTREDIPRVIEEIGRFLDTTDQFDILADVRGAPKVEFGMIVEELKHLPALFRMVHALDRVALIADEGWIRTAAAIESKLIPGVDYQVYTRAEAAHARDWLLRHTDIAHG
ncbi:STAS/SEC14 domain-containing protein [Sphingomonas sp.]|uniref:STAS/SEC14 domain-containing protein n=1 Tax=Sphingomonas sp. TaxID=28214 RepID=UPI003D6D6EE7